MNDTQPSMPDAPGRTLPDPQGGALLGEGAVLVWNDVAPEGREQFYAWHDKEHIPERLAIPGFRRGRRYIRHGHSPEWLTMYEADDLDVLVSPQYLARLNAPTPATVRTIRHFRNTSRAVCRVVYSTGSSSGGHMLTLRIDVPAAQADAMCRYLRTEALSRAMALTGVVACHLYVADQSASHLNTAESSNREFDIPSWVVLAEATTLGAAELAHALIDGPALRSLGVSVRSDAAIYSLEICRLASPASVP
ncbi:MAG: hypothetical protein ABI831_05980 [Betaproteobacteria bacterium]